MDLKSFLRKRIKKCEDEGDRETAYRLQKLLDDIDETEGGEVI